MTNPFSFVYHNTSLLWSLWRRIALAFRTLLVRFIISAVMRVVPCCRSANNPGVPVPGNCAHRNVFQAQAIFVAPLMLPSALEVGVCVRTHLAGISVGSSDELQERHTIGLFALNVELFEDFVWSNRVQTRTEDLLMTKGKLTYAATREVMWTCDTCGGPSDMTRNSHTVPMDCIQDKKFC